MTSDYLMLSMAYGSRLERPNTGNLGAVVLDIPALKCSRSTTTERQKRWRLIWAHARRQRIRPTWPK